MNFMHIVHSNKFTNNRYLNSKLKDIKDCISENNILISENLIKLGDSKYCLNALPYIPESRDLYKKTNSLCKMYVNWKKKDFTGFTTDEICDKLKLQYGFCITIVDKGYKRNKFKNKEDIWVVFDTKKQAEKNLKIFNMMFRTAIEQDAIDEYKKFRINPLKKPLTYDKLVDNAYELYDLVDKGEL